MFAGFQQPYVGDLWDFLGIFVGQQAEHRPVPTNLALVSEFGKITVCDFGDLVVCF